MALSAQRPSGELEAIWHPGSSSVLEVSWIGTGCGDLHVSAVLNDGCLFSGSFMSFSCFAGAVGGVPVRRWEEINSSLTCPLTSLDATHVRSTAQECLIKAACLLCLRLGAHFCRPVELVNELSDILLIEATGRLGTQPYIYFPPVRFLEGASQDACEGLFARRVLSRVSIGISGQEPRTRLGQRYFTPLNLREALMDRRSWPPEDEPTRDLWEQIMSLLEDRFTDQHGASR